MKKRSWLGRFLLGPTDEEINARVITSGGPGYPTPPLPITPPTTTALSGSAGIVESAEAECTCGGTRTGQPHTRICPVARRARRLANLIDNGDIPAEIVRAYHIPDLDRQTQLVNLRPAVDRIRAGQTSRKFADTIAANAELIRRAMLPTSVTTIRTVDLDTGEPVTQPDHGIVPDQPETERPGDGRAGSSLPPPNPTTDSGLHALPDTPETLPSLSGPCPHCGGTGTVTRTVNDLLRDTVAMIPVDGGDKVIAEFYRRLLAAAPDLAPLFPTDLITAATNDQASPGALQRDRLLRAVVAVADLYGTGGDAMTRLDNAITSMGNRHAAFARPDGTVRGATPQEYDAVNNVFIGLCSDAFGDRFTDAHRQAWAEALEYVKVGMLWAQWHSQMRMPRMPRTAQTGE